MSTISLRRSGRIGKEEEAFLETLIVNACKLNPFTHHMSLQAKEDFEWDSGCLAAYVLAGLMDGQSYYQEGFISSGDWLCGVFTSGNLLSNEHIRILMSFVNSNTNLFQESYTSGKQLWRDAPPSLKTILDALDDGCVKNVSVTVDVPLVVPLDESQAIEELERLPFEDVKTKVKIIWNDDFKSKPFKT